MRETGSADRIWLVQGFNSSVAHHFFRRAGVHTVRVPKSESSLRFLRQDGLQCALQRHDTRDGGVGLLRQLRRDDVSAPADASTSQAECGRVETSTHERKEAQCRRQWRVIFAKHRLSCPMIRTFIGHSRTAHRSSGTTQRKARRNAGSNGFSLSSHRPKHPAHEKESP